MPDLISFDQLALERVESALQVEEDGRRLKREFGANLRAAVEPALPLIRGDLLGMATSGLAVSPPLRTSVLDRMKVATRFSGGSPGVRVAIGRTPHVRGFDDAPRKLNRGSWSHPVYGRGSVEQTGREGFFDRPLAERRDELRAAVVQAVQDMADRIAAAG